MSKTLRNKVASLKPIRRISACSSRAHKRNPTSYLESDAGSICYKIAANVLKKDRTEVT